MEFFGAYSMIGMVLLAISAANPKQADIRALHKIKEDFPMWAIIPSIIVTIPIVALIWPIWIFTLFDGKK